jgi:hypothetical protein
VAVNTNGTTAYLTIPYATESRYLQCPDTRNTNIVPSSYSAGLSADFKSKSITGLTAAYAGVITFRPYSNASDWTGGPIHNLAFDANGIHHRTASSDTWGSWKTLAYTSDIPIVTNYYWANVKISATSNAATTPTFANTIVNGTLAINGSNAYPLVINSSHATENGLVIRMSGTNKAWVGYTTGTGAYLYTYTGPHKIGISDAGVGFIDSNIILHSGNSSVADGGSTWGSKLTVKINGTTKTLTIPANPNTDSKVS